MAKEYTWAVDGHRITATFKINKYVIHVDDDHVTNVYRLPAKQMRFGMEESVTILGKTCLFIVWDEIPDLVIDGKMVRRGVDYTKAKESRRRNMIAIYTAIAVFGLIDLLGVFLYAWFGFLLMTDDAIRVWSALLSAGIWMVGMGLWMRWKWELNG